MEERLAVRRDVFYDSVTLMHASEAARALDGVTHAAVGMVTGLTSVIWTLRFGFDLKQLSPLGPRDAVIAVRADTSHAADAAVEVVDQYLLAHAGEREVLAVGPYTLRGDTGGSRGTRRVEWGGEPAGHSALAGLEARADRIAKANDEAVRRLQDARPVLVGVTTAGEVLEDFDEGSFLHAGPPLDWADMNAPMRGAVVGAALFEGLADDPDEVVRRAEAGEFRFSPGHERGGLGPMAGVVSPSMPVWIVENAARGNRSYCTFSEGLGEMLRFGAYGPRVIERLRWMADVLYPVMAETLQRLDQPLDLRQLAAEAVQMGDEVHNHNRAATSLLVRQLAPALVQVERASSEVTEAVRFLALSDYTFLNLSMPAAKVAADAAAGIADSTIITCMARNGTEFGLRMSGTGDQWFTGPAAEIDACFLPGYGTDDRSRDMGDSTITETIGLGAFALAAAPALGTYVGTSAEDAMRATLTMYDITWAESLHYRIPALGFRGTPVGIDARKVAETGVLPALDTGIAHRDAGVGVIGGGIVRPPMHPFVAALAALEKRDA